MANRDITPYLPVGRSNGGNVACLRTLEGDALPQHSYAPEVLASWQLDHVAIRDLADSAIETSTIELDGDESDGDYILTLAGTLADGSAFEVDLDAFAASGDTNADIAAGLEAIIQAARGVGEDLEGIVTGETVTDETITTTLAAGVVGTWSLEAPAGGSATVVRSFSLGITINTLFANDAFPANVLRGEPAMRVDIAFTGVAGVSAVFGDDNSDGGSAAANGLVTITSLTSAGYFSTPGATQYAERVEAAMSPTASFLFTTDPPASLTAGKVTFFLAYYPLPA